MCSESAYDDSAVGGVCLFEQEQGDKGASWMVQAAEKRGQLGLAAACKPWTPGMQGTGMPRTKRVDEILDVAAATHLAPSQWDLRFVEKQNLLRHVYCDVSQNPGQLKCTNRQGITSALTQSTIMYSFGRDGLVLPRELMMLKDTSVISECRPPSAADSCELWREKAYACPAWVQFFGRFT